MMSAWEIMTSMIGFVAILWFFVLFPVVCLLLIRNSSVQSTIERTSELARYYATYCTCAQTSFPTRKEHFQIEGHMAGTCLLLR